ncbi:MAG TPA: ester cyclase [Polyangiaceae bacterium]|nr:ester cyclase [Polyangiaceae bacterium]
MKSTVYRTFAGACLLALAACGGSDPSALADDAASSDADPPSGVAAGDSPSDALPVSEQVARIEQRLAATNSRDWDSWQALHTPDAVRTAPELEQPLEGSAAMRAAIETLSTAFPDYHLELRQAFGQGEWLAVRLHTTGTMTGPLVLSDGTSVPATGQPIDQDWAALVRFQGDRISEFHEFYDQLLLMVQLGLVAP